MNWIELVGMKIVAFRGIPEKHRFGKQKENVPLSCILFDDQETILTFSEQDYYDYHDCSPSARTVELRKDAKLWKEMLNQEGCYKAPTDLDCPF